MLVKTRFNRCNGTKIWQIVLCLQRFSRNLKYTIVKLIRCRQVRIKDFVLDISITIPATAKFAGRKFALQMIIDEERLLNACQCLIKQKTATITGVSSEWISLHGGGRVLLGVSSSYFLVAGTSSLAEEALVLSGILFTKTSWVLGYHSVTQKAFIDRNLDWTCTWQVIIVWQGLNLLIGRVNNLMAFIRISSIYIQMNRLRVCVIRIVEFSRTWIRLNEIGGSIFFFYN